MFTGYRLHGRIDMMSFIYRLLFCLLVFVVIIFDFEFFFFFWGGGSVGGSKLSFFALIVSYLAKCIV